MTQTDFHIRFSIQLHGQKLTFSPEPEGDDNFDETAKLLLQARWQKFDQQLREKAARSILAEEMGAEAAELIQFEICNEPEP